MNSKRTGYLVLIQILITIGVSLWINLGSPFFSLGIIPNLLLSQGMMLIPAVVMLILFEKKLWRRDDLGQYMGLVAVGRIKPFSYIFIILYTWLITPLVTLFNLLSQFFDSNEALLISDELLELPLWVMFLLVAIVGPMCEEFVFRGVIYGAFRRTGNVMAAIFIQALLFGLVHMNFNQFCYAFVFGITMGLLVEATGSIAASFLMHAFVNGSNVMSMYSVAASGVNLTEVAGDAMDKAFLLRAVCIFLIIAVVFTVFAMMVLYNIAKIQGREQLLLRLPYFKGQERIFSIPLGIAIFLYTTIIILTTILERLYGTNI